MAETEVKLDTKAWNSLLNKIGSKLKNVYPELRAATNTFGFKDIIEHFKQERGPAGRWARLKYRKGKALQDTGRLRNSLLPGSGMQERVGNNAVLLFTNVEYAGTHNYGKGKIPQREFMWLSSNAQEQILNYIMNKLV